MIYHFSLIKFPAYYLWIEAFAFCHEKAFCQKFFSASEASCGDRGIIRMFEEKIFHHINFNLLLFGALIKIRVEWERRVNFFKLILEITSAN